ncbi:MAG: ATP-binding protein [Caldisericia bacterium]
MLINFTLENWMSFRDKTAFSMIASEERQHSDRLSYIKKYNLKINPIASIYGANASGKSNLLEAFKFAKNLILNVKNKDEKILRKPFKLEVDTLNKPSLFIFEILIKETIYEYSFAVDNEMVHYERLTEIKAKEEVTIFDRKEDHIQLCDAIKDIEKANADSTKPNELFIAKAIFNNTKCKSFILIDQWFRRRLYLDLNFRNIPLHALTAYDNKDYAEITIRLCSLIVKYIDQGITKLKVVERPMEIEMIDPSEYQDLIGNIKKWGFGIHKSGHIVTYNESNELVEKKVTPFHKNSLGQEIPFEYKDESDGTRKFLSLLPVLMPFLIPPVHEGRVLIIDELDRSFHTLLSRAILQLICAISTKSNRSQLIFSTHDVDLMDQELLRRDEMWITEKDAYGVSKLYSIGDFEGIRNDKKLDKMYLRGQIGGTPEIDIQKLIELIQELRESL